MKYDINYRGRRSTWDTITQDLTLEDFKNASEGIEQIDKELKEHSIYGLLDRNRPLTIKEIILLPLIYLISHLVFYVVYYGAKYKIRKFKRKNPEHIF